MNDLVDRFGADCQVRNIAGTIYVRYAGKFSEFLEGREKEPCQVEKQDLVDFLIELREERQLKPASIDRVFTCISQFYAFLVDEELIAANPVTPFKARYLRRYKDDKGSDPRQMISVEQASMLVNSVLDSRDKAMLTLLFKTGMREGELSSLDVADLDLENMELTLKPSTKRSNRLLFFDYETAEVLRVWLNAREGRRTRADALFTSRKIDRLGTSQINKLVKKHAQRVGLHNPDSTNLSERFTPHCCRHCWTTWLLDAGMKREYVQWLRGDAIRDAIDIYYHINPEDVKKSYMAHIPQLGT